MFGSVLLFFSCFSNKLYSNRALSVLNSTKTFSKKLEDYGAYVFFSYGGGYNDTIFKDNRALSVLNSTKTFSKKLEDYGAYVFFSYGGGYNDTIFKDNIIHLCCVQHNYTVIHGIGFNICIFSIN